MPARTLLIGLDGADFEVIDGLGPARLPHLHAAKERGAWSRLRSVLPPATLPNWTTFLTGLDPGQHGVFDFTTRSGTRVAFAGGTVREAPTIFERLDRLGLRCACLGFPATWPPPRLEHGIFVSGWDSPVAFEADRSFVWPPSLYDSLRRRFGPWRWGDIDEGNADRPGWHEDLSDCLVNRVEQRTAICEWLLTGSAWDAFAIYFGESDTASHHLWAHYDARSPRHPRATATRAREGLARTYQALDRAVGALWKCAGAEAVELTILSDHGSGGSSDKAVYLNRALEAAGLLRFKSKGWGRRFGEGAWSPTGSLKDLGLAHLPPRLRDRVFRAAGRYLPGRLESNARFGSIDFGHTQVFSDELNYFPALHVNLRDREPQGIVAHSELRALRARLEAFADGLRDPWSGNRIIASVMAREELYTGEFVSRAPDFLLQLELDRGYSYNLLPSASAPVGVGAFRRLGPHEYLGRKGRSMPGSHRDRGVWIAAGPRVRSVGEIDARMADTTVTVLARLGVAAPQEMPGRVLREALSSGRATTVLPVAEPTRAPRAAMERTEERLRALGYID